VWLGDDFGTRQRAKKTSKSLRVRLGDGLAAALVDMGRGDADTNLAKPDMETGTNNVEVLDGVMCNQKINYHFRDRCQHQ
jgi:hypothetical protein